VATPLVAAIAILSPAAHAGSLTVNMVASTTPTGSQTLKLSEQGGSGFFSVDSSSSEGSSASCSAAFLAAPTPGVSISASSVGTTYQGPNGTQFANGSVDAVGTLSYSFQAQGPVGSSVLVPVLFVGKTFGTGTETGNGSSLSLTFPGQTSYRSLGDAADFTTIQTQTNGQQYFSAAWGSAAGVNRSGNYSATFEYEIYAVANTPVQAQLAAYLTEGGGHNGAAGGSVYIDPQFSIDPVWASTHPGYSIAVESGFGNGAPVPEPAVTALWLVGLGIVGPLSKMRRSRTRPGADAMASPWRNVSG
jgi:hypothetical protein